jgi:dihydroflavonol-4-reductase
VEDIDETKMFSHSAFDTSYGLAKFLAEQEVWRGYAEGLNVAIINPSTIIGHGDKMKSSMQLFERIRFNKMPYYPLGSTGWVDIVDVAKATINCLSSNINGQRYIISAENIGYKDVFDLIASSIGQKYNGKPLTPFLSSFLIRIEWFIQFFTKNNPFINKETIKSTSAKSHYINTKSVRDLSIEYKDIRMSIKKAAETYVLGQI